MTISTSIIVDVSDSEGNPRVGACVQVSTADFIGELIETDARGVALVELPFGSEGRLEITVYIEGERVGVYDVVAGDKLYC